MVNTSNFSYTIYHLYKFLDSILHDNLLLTKHTGEDLNIHSLFDNISQKIIMSLIHHCMNYLLLEDEIPIKLLTCLTYPQIISSFPLKIYGIISYLFPLVYYYHQCIYLFIFLNLLMNDFQAFLFFSFFSSQSLNMLGTFCNLSFF